MSHFPVPPLFLPEGPPGILLSPLHHPRRDKSPSIAVGLAVHRVPDSAAWLVPPGTGKYVFGGLCLDNLLFLRYIAPLSGEIDARFRLTYLF